MIIRIFKKNKIQNKVDFVEPDEIFLDSTNLADFDVQQFEGRIEKPISKQTVYFFGGFFALILVVFTFQLFNLQIKKGEAFLERSENNKLDQDIIFADRGIIYDRNGKEIAWNKKNEMTLLNKNEEGINEDNTLSFREYLNPGFSHVVGYVTSPTKDKSGKYWQTDFIGKEGLEKQYSDRLKGENGSRLIETDALGKLHSFNVINPPKRGPDLVTTLDAPLQQAVYNSMKKLADNYAFTGGAGVIMDIHTGELLTAVSFPEYNSQILSEGKDSETINSYLTDKRKLFLNRFASGLYTPGSIVKPFFALGALMENLIPPSKEIFSAGSISIPNPYDKTKPTIFKDWKAHGWTDMREAIAVSSDVYFYSIGGGFGDQKGMGILNIEKYSRLFKIGEKTGVDLPQEKEGVIPNPEWKSKNFNGEPWRIGNTFHTSIGQYGFQVTPLEMTRATAALANGGIFPTPHFLLNDAEMINKKEHITLDKEYLKIIHEGMREAVTYGTAVPLNVQYVEVAAKTGTAQLGISKSRVNSWIIGFFPYENPKYAFTLMMESGPSNAGVGASSAMREILDWMNENTPQYFK